MAIRILRKQTSGVPASLAFGQMAYNEADNILYIGLHDNSVLAIGGSGYLALKANAALTGVPTAPTAANGTNTTQLATTAFVQDALVGAGAGDMLKSVYDPNNDGVVVDSDKLGGTVAASYALKTYVDNAIANLINSAPGALDTLKELADAIGDDANFASTVTTALALKAPLASPALTGNPTAPTATRGDNDTSIATTAFVQDALDDGTF